MGICMGSRGSCWDACYVLGLNGFVMRMRLMMVSIASQASASHGTSMTPGDSTCQREAPYKLEAAVAG
jgi:hypothetical protein